MALSNTQITNFLAERFDVENKKSNKMSKILAAAAKAARAQEKIKSKGKKVFIELRKQLKERKLELNKAAAAMTKVVKAEMRVANRAAAKAAKLAEKEAKKAAKLAEKEAAKAAKLAEKEAKKAEKLQEKEAAKAAKLEEKELAKAAKLAEKEAAKAVKLAEKVAAKAKKLAEKEEAKRTKWLETHEVELKKYRIGPNETNGTPLCALKGLLKNSKKLAKEATKPEPVVSRIE
jgi:hypothetical protein